MDDQRIPTPQISVTQPNSPKRDVKNSNLALPLPVPAITMQRLVYIIETYL